MPEANDRRPRAHVRAARRHDVPALTDLRVHALAEIARHERRYEILPDVRTRTEHALPLWMEQDERVVLVAEAVEGGRLLGYGLGLSTVWPPVLRHQHVGEIGEVYVVPEARGEGLGRDLVAALGAALGRRGATMLRASVPTASEEAQARFRALGFAPLQHVLEKSLEGED